MSENYCFEVHEKIKREERVNWKLYVDAVYKELYETFLNKEFPGSGAYIK